MSAIADMSMREIATAIRRRTLSATEVLGAHLKRIDTRNPVVNAVIRRNDELALARAANADAAAQKEQWWGPLHGVPFTAKDMFATRDFPTTFGLPHLTDHRPDEDAALVRRYLDAGAILVGKTNIPTFSYDWQTNHPRFGRCNNPFDVERTVGGSSGGSAASVSSGMAAFDIGSDVAGSIRVPCHHCHVFGLRPTEGVLPDEGHGAIPSAAGTVDHITVVGPIARTAGDLELLFRVADRRDTASADVAPPGELRIAWSDSLGDVPIDQDMQSAMNALRTTLEAAGAQVVDAAPAVSTDAAVEIWGHVNGYEMANAFPRLATLPFVKQATAWWFFEKRLGRGALAAAAQEGFNAETDDFEEALSRRSRMMRAVDSFFADFDAWIVPALPVPPFEHRPTGAPIDVDDVSYPYADLHATYHCTIAAFGAPVVSIPSGITAKGLPVGIQLIGRRHRDLELLSVARSIATVIPDRATPDPSVDEPV